MSGSTYGSHSFPQTSPCFSSPLSDFLAVCVRRSTYVVSACGFSASIKCGLKALSFSYFHTTHYHPRLSIPPLSTIFYTFPILYHSGKHVLSPLPQPAKPLLGFHRRPRRLPRQPPFFKCLQPRVSRTSRSTSRVRRARSLGPP